jgi:drug/metabolite transporter (DMT)-like permease
MRANALLIVVTMIWGSSFLIVQHTLTLVGPFTFLAMRFGFAALVLAFLFRKRLVHITYSEIFTGSIIWIGCGCMLSSMLVGEMRLAWLVNTSLVRNLVSRTYRLIER